MMRLLNKLRGRPSCEEIMLVMQAYLDGEVEIEEARRVAAHLEYCTECDRESQVYKSIKQSLAGHRRQIDPDVLHALRQFGEQLESAE